ncbi:MAG: hypothetical protein M3040_18555 [Bacteroidota bacterium]|nr:hypothetical protein [Bacteroidota bacterium]
MLENLKNLVREYAGDAIINNPAIPNDRNEEAVADASSSIVSGLKTAVANGKADEVQNLFNNSPEAAASSPVAQNIQLGFAQNLMQKFGLDSGKAGGIAASLIPMVLQKFVHKTNDPNDKSFDLSSVLSSLAGGAGLGSIMNNLGGGDKDGGGILGKIGGMFK